MKQHTGKRRTVLEWYYSMCFMGGSSGTQRFLSYLCIWEALQCPSNFGSFQLLSAPWQLARLYDVLMGVQLGFLFAFFSLPFFLPLSILPSLPLHPSLHYAYSFLPSFLPCSIPSFFPVFLPCFLPSFRYSIVYPLEGGLQRIKIFGEFPHQIVQMLTTH